MQDERSDAGDQDVKAGADARRHAAESRLAFYDKNYGWERAFIAPDAKPDAVDDLAVVLSACDAMRRLMAVVEEEACAHPDVAARIRRAITIERPVDVRWPGTALGMGAALDFLLGVAEENREFTNFSARITSCLAISALCPPPEPED